MSDFKMVLRSDYLANNRTLNFRFLLKPFFPYIRRQFEKHFEYGEGLMLNFLRSRKQSLRFSDIYNILTYFHIPIICVYLLLGSIMISLLMIPIVCRKRSFCLGKIIVSSTLRTRCCLLMEIIIFIFSGICLMCGIICLYQTTLGFQEILMVFPPLWQSIVLNLASNCDLLKIQATSVVNDIKTSCNLIINETTQIPILSAGNISDTELNRNSNAVQSYLNTQHFQTLEVIFNKSKQNFHSLEDGFKTIRIKYSQLMEFVDLIGGNNESFVEKDIASYFFEKSPNWKVIQLNLKAVFQKSLPNLIRSLSFENNLLIKIQDASKDELGRITRATTTLHESASTVGRKIDAALDELFPQTLQDFVVCKADCVINYMSSLEMFDNSKDKNIFLNGNLWIILIPFFLVLALFLLLAHSFITSRRHLKVIIFKPSHSQRLHHMKDTSKILKLFRICIIFSMSILWILLIIAVAFYCIHLPLSIFCKAIDNERFLTDYMDDQTVWNNKTWLDNKLHAFLPPHRAKLKIKNILYQCSSNKTIYKSLEMHQYWNISKFINQLNIRVNVTNLLHKIMSQAISGTRTPDVEIDNLLKKLSTIENHFNLPNVTDRLQLESEIRNFNSKLEKRLQRLKMGDDKLMKLMLDDLKTLSEADLPNLLENMSDLLYLKFNLKTTITKLKSLKLLIGNFTEVIERAPKRISSILETAADKIKITLEKLVTQTIVKIENEVGNCQILPVVYKTAAWTTCHHGLTVINAAWLSLLLICISISLCAILSCRIYAHIRGTINNFCFWRGSTMESYRYSNETARLNGTFIFNKSISTENHFTRTEEIVNRAN